MDAQLGCFCALLVTLIVVSSGDSDIRYVKVGGKVHFKPEPILSSGSTITWKFKGNGNVIRVTEFKQGEDAKAQNPIFMSTAADKFTGELILRDLTLEHSGLYRFEINGKERDQKFTLTVMNSIPKPQLAKEASSIPDVVYLMCEYDASIHWTCSNEENPVGSLLEEPRQGEFLTFTRSRNPDICCSCTLKNAVSEETSDPLCEKDLFPDSTEMIIGSIIPLISITVILLYLFICHTPFQGCCACCGKRKVYRK